MRLNDLNLDLADKDSIRERLSLEYVCEQYGLKLDKEGRALCPWHDDKRPSFRLYIHDDGHTKWHCFPCSAGGDVFDFISRMDGIGFNAALAKANSILNRVPKGWEPKIELDFALGSPDEWAHDVAEAQAIAASDPITVARALGFPEIMGGYLIEMWGLGFGIHEIAGTDVVAHVLFPHWAPDGRLTGCKARSPRGDKVSLGGSRYTHLYGAWRPRYWPRSIVLEGERDTHYALYASLTEGLSLNVYGLPRGAGAHVTEEQITSLRGSETVFLAFDPDEEGEAAIRKWTHALKDEVPEVKRCFLPPNTDIAKLRPELSVLLRNAR